MADQEHVLLDDVAAKRVLCPILTPNGPVEPIVEFEKSYGRPFDVLNRLGIFEVLLQEADDRGDGGVPRAVLGLFGQLRERYEALVAEGLRSAAIRSSSSMRRAVTSASWSSRSDGMVPPVSLASLKRRSESAQLPFSFSASASS